MMLSCRFQSVEVREQHSDFDSFNLNVLSASPVRLLRGKKKACNNSSSQTEGKFFSLVQMTH